jgi:hypothetical protein
MAMSISEMKTVLQASDIVGKTFIQKDRVHKITGFADGIRHGVAVLDVERDCQCTYPTKFIYDEMNRGRLA